MVVSRMTRRAALAALAGMLVARHAFATTDQARDWIAAMAKGTPKDGKVVLKAPEIAENGNAVPLTVTVEGEMSEKSWVKAIYIAADGNPNPGVAVYEFTPLKRHFRRRCRESVRSGFEFGLCCVGSSIGLMLMLLALGVMTITWMSVIAVVVLAQKLLPARAAIDVPLALAIVGLGLWIALAPPSVPGLMPLM